MGFLDYLDILETGMTLNLRELITEDDLNTLDDKHKNLLNIGKEISNQLKIIFNGIWDDEMGTLYLTFTDPKVKTTFIARDKEETIKNLNRIRQTDFSMVNA